MMGMGEEQVDGGSLAGGRSVAQLTGEFVAQRHYAGAGIDDENMPPVTNLQAGGVAAEARAGDQCGRVGTTYSPEARAKPAAVAGSGGTSIIEDCLGGGAVRRLELAVK